MKGKTCLMSSIGLDVVSLKFRSEVGSQETYNPFNTLGWMMGWNRR